MKLRISVLAVACAAGLMAQDAPMFPKPAYFRKMFSNPPTRVELQAPSKLADFVADGKMELSLRSFLDLVMANNTDVSIQKLAVESPRNAIQRAFGAYDPTLTIGANYNNRATPAADQLQGAAINKTTTMGPLQFDYRQLLSSGTTLTSRFNGQKQSSNSGYTTFNPAFTSLFQGGFSQPLIRGRDGTVLRMPITIARARLRSAEFGVNNQILTLVQNAENAYWDVVGARETLRVREEALKMRAESLKRSQRELELGAIPQLDIYQPQADYASAEIQVSQSRYRLAQLEDALRRQIGADLDPKFRTMPMVLTETVMPPAEATALDREVLVERAISSRPDLAANRVTLEIDDMNLRTSADALRPDLSLTGTYASNGRGGTQYIRSSELGGTISKVIPGGLSSALTQVFNFNYSTYTMGLSLTLPLRNRAGAANLADVLVQKKQDALNLRKAEQGVRLDVLNAVSQVESSRESVKLALVARDLAQKQLDAEKQKYDLGTTTMYYVLDAQTRLTNAESSVVTESINYRRNQLTLSRVVGSLLSDRGITVQ